MEEESGKSVGQENIHIENETNETKSSAISGI